MVGAKALGLGIGLAHVLAFLGLAIPLIALAMVDLGLRVNPYLAWTTTRCSSGRWGLSGLRGRRRSSRCRGWCWGWCWRRCSRGRCGWRRAGPGRGGVPIFYPLVPRAGAFFRGGSCVCAVLAHTGGVGRSTGRRLRQTHRRADEPGSNQHRLDRDSHEQFPFAIKHRYWMTTYPERPTAPADARRRHLQ